MSDENFLSRWSRKKAASKAGPAGPSADVPAKPAPVVGKPGAGTQASAAPTAAVPAPGGTQSPEPLPPTESLTIDSDFSPFMQSGVDPLLRRQALKTLLHDPRFNVMDGLDTYIADYSQSDPLPDGWLEKMNQVKHLGIFKDPDEEAAPGAAPPPEAAEKAQAEQPVEPELPEPRPDTSSAQISPPQVGKSNPPRDGDADVLV